MKKLYFSIFLLMIFWPHAISQEKTINGDTTFLHQWNKSLVKKLQLNDLFKSKDDFNFRFWNTGQVVEFQKNGDVIQANFTNYIFRQNRRSVRIDTLFQKIVLPQQTANDIYQIIINSGILEIPSDYMIEDWSSGVDGITYVMEYSDKDNYWYKSYWTPSIQKGFPESLIVNGFVNNLSDTLKLADHYRKFKDGLPHYGCYTSGGMSVTCYIPNSYIIGYSGSLRLPAGYTASAYWSYLGKVKTNFGLSFYHQFDKNGDYDFVLSLNKARILFHKSTQMSDFLAYDYRKKKIDDLYPDVVYQSHKIYYGLSYYLNVGLGADFLTGNQRQTGGFLYLGKWINTAGINIFGRISIFDDHSDIKTGISKVFYLKKTFLHGINIGVSYERFVYQDDVSFSLTLQL